MTLVRMTQRARPPVVVVALTVLALAGCGGSSGGTAGQTQVSTTATAAETTGKTLDFCAREDATTKIVHFRGAGTDLDGVVIGSGANGVVLAHQLHSNVCSWLPFAQRLAGGGVRVLVFDFPGTTDLDRYVLAAVAELTVLGGHVTLTASDEGAHASICIEDDGVGSDPDEIRAALDGRPERDSLGLGNVDARLRQVYGDDFGLVVETQVGAGTKVGFRVPKYAPGVHPTT